LADKSFFKFFLLSEKSAISEPEKKAEPTKSIRIKIILNCQPTSKN
jgi:hypothetical protein